MNAKAKKYIGLFSEAKGEERILIEDLDGIYAHADRIRETVKRYVGES